MADVQISEPLVDENFTDRGWRAAFAGRTGVISDADGSSFGLTLPAEGATAELGSATQPSRLVVDGYGLEVAQGASQSVDIPASSGGGTNGRTDLIVARLNLSSFTTAPGPVRLFRIAGTEGSLSVPAATYDQDGIRDLPLYAVRRRQGESLNQAIVTDLRPRLAYNYDIPAQAPLPTGAPLGSRASRSSIVYRRDFVGTTLDWIEEWRAREVLTSASVREVNGEAFGIRPQSRLVREGPGGQDRRLNLVMVWNGAWYNPQADGEARMARLFTQDRPNVAGVGLVGFARRSNGDHYAISGRVDTDGWVTWQFLGSEDRVPGATVLTLTGEWTRE